MNIFQKLFGLKLSVDLPSQKNIKFSVTDSSKIRAEKILRSSGLVVNKEFCEMLDGAARALEKYRELDEQEKNLAVANALAEYGITDLVKQYHSVNKKNTEPRKKAANKTVKTPKAPVISIVPKLELAVQETVPVVVKDKTEDKPKTTKIAKVKDEKSKAPSKVTAKKTKVSSSVTEQKS